MRIPLNLGQHLTFSFFLLRIKRKLKLVSNQLQFPSWCTERKKHYKQHSRIGNLHMPINIQTNWNTSHYLIIIRIISTSLKQQKIYFSLSQVRARGKMNFYFIPHYTNIACILQLSLSLKYNLFPSQSEARIRGTKADYERVVYVNRFMLFVNLFFVW